MENSPILGAQAHPSQTAPDPLALCPSSAYLLLLKGLDQWRNSPASTPILGLLEPKDQLQSAPGVGLCLH